MKLDEEEPDITQNSRWKLVRMSESDFASVARNRTVVEFDLKSPFNPYPEDEYRCVAILGNSDEVIKLTGLDPYLIYCKSNDEDSFSCSLEGNKLYLALDTNLVGIDLEMKEILFEVKADQSSLFELFTLEDDFLTRGEIEIMRISKTGKVIWTYSGMDIWVSISHEPEIVIHEDKIALLDFSRNKYFIDYNGKTLSVKKQSWWRRLIDWVS